MGALDCAPLGWARPLLGLEETREGGGYLSGHQKSKAVVPVLVQRTSLCLPRFPLLSVNALEQVLRRSRVSGMGESWGWSVSVWASYTSSSFNDKLPLSDLGKPPNLCKSPFITCKG